MIPAVKGERNIVAVEENNMLQPHSWKVNVMEHFPVKTAENSVSIS